MKKLILRATFILSLFLFLYPLTNSAQTRLKEPDKVTQARQDVADDPEDSNVHYNLGLALMKSIESSLRAEKGLTEQEATVANEVESCFKKALELSDSTHGRALIMLGWLYKFRSEYDAAIPLLTKALQLPPESADYQKAADVLAACYMMQNKMDEARSVVKEALKYHPDDSALNEKESVLSNYKPEDYSKSTFVPQDDRQQKAMDLGAELQKQMEKIMNSEDPADIKQKKVAKAQEEYQKKVKALYGQ